MYTSTILCVNGRTHTPYTNTHQLLRYMQTIENADAIYARLCYHVDRHHLKQQKHELVAYMNTCTYAGAYGTHT